MLARGVTWGDRKGRGRARLIVGALAVVAVASPGAMTSQPAAGETARFIVQAVPGGLEAAKSAVQRLGGRVLSPLGVINGFTASIRTGSVPALRSSSGVRTATPDARVSLQGGTYSPIYDAGAPQALAQAVGADMYWQNGFYGQGVGVAVLDSGVVKVDGLSNVSYGPDLTPEGDDVYLRNLDTFGHGTFMAGLIGGRSAGLSRPYLANYADTTYLGVAPEAKIISVKAADSIGQTYTSTIVQGIDWVVQHRTDSGLNIRVLNLSLGLPDASGYQNDPVSAAAERAWAAGIVVVAAGGNDGTVGLLLPAADPYVIATGALDSQNTVSMSDDTVAAFSNRGTASRLPDFVAPGTHLVGLRVPGSYIDQTYGSTGAVSARFFRGSGTSEAAAITSGAAALLLSQNPTAKPDQVKALLKMSARGLTAPTRSDAGTTALYVGGQFGYPSPSASQTWAHATNWSTPSTNWSGGTWAGAVWTAAGATAPTTGLSSARWTGTSWSSGRWTGAVWTSGRWTGAHWTGTSWSNAGWR
jgi:serine protease AprX